MPGIRFFACDGCETVFADVVEPPRCLNCGARSVQEISLGGTAADYFLPTET